MTDENKVIVIQQNRWLPIGMIVSILLILGMAIFGYLAYQRMKSDNAILQTQVVEFKKLTEDLVQSSSKWVTKGDLDRQLATLLKPEDLAALRKELKAQGAQLSAVGQTIGKISERISKLEGSDGVGPENPDVTKCADGRLIDVYEYTKQAQIKRLEDSQNAPIADVTFDASKQKPWSYDIFEKQFKVVTTVGKKDSGQLVFDHKLSYSVPKFGDKEYNVNVTSSEFQQALPNSKMFWLNPKIDMTIFGGGMIFPFAKGPGHPDTIGSVGVDLGISLSSYGYNQLDSWWRFFRFGLGYDAARQAAAFSFAPALFNVGRSLPLLTNLYIGPAFGIDSAGGGMLTLHIGPQF